MKSPGKDILFAAVICGCSLLSLGQEMVPVHGHQLFLICEGPSAGPTVILMAGGGGTMKIWDKVQPQVATFARVCSYDRAGLGESSAIKEPQSAAEIADDLAVLLETAHVPTPYILVGHSIGGIYVREYDKQEDSKVSAMVLIDSSHEEQIWRFAKTMPEALSEYPQWRDTKAMSAQGFLPPDEHLDWHFSKPLIVLEKGIPPEPVWHEMQEDLAKRSPEGKLVIATHSRHYIQKDDPEMVIGSIRTVLAQSVHKQPMDKKDLVR
jgi:thioesterase domain-containing protein